MSSSVPRLVIAAPSSGSGKTTVATGLMAAFAARGLAVSPHKVGPDYIDPGYHALATGRVGRNLDAYLCGPELIGPLFLRGASGCDIAVVEGVMGLYDGAAGEGELAFQPRGLLLFDRQGHQAQFPQPGHDHLLVGAFDRPLAGASGTVAGFVVEGGNGGHG